MLTVNDVISELERLLPKEDGKTVGVEGTLPKDHYPTPVLLKHLQESLNDSIKYDITYKISNIFEGVRFRYIFISKAYSQEIWCELCWGERA